MRPWIAIVSMSAVVGCSEGEHARVDGDDAEVIADQHTSTSFEIDAGHEVEHDAEHEVEHDAEPDAEHEVEHDTEHDVVSPAWRWESLPSLPEAIQENAVVHDGERLWVLGGFQGFAVVDKTFVYDVADRSWASGPKLPVTLHHGNGAFADGRVWVVGALEGLAFAASGRTWSLDPMAAGPAWTEGPTMPASRRRGASAVVVIGDVIYLLGGYRAGAVRQCDGFDASAGSFRELADLPADRDHVVAGAIAGRLYVAGGRDGDIDAIADDVWALDPAIEGATWALETRLPTARGGASAAVIGDRLVVIGGEGDDRADSGVFPDVELYDPATKSWTTLPAMTTPRHGTQAASFAGAIWIPGGADVIAFGATDVFERLVAP